MNIQRANKPKRSHKEREEPLDTIAEILIVMNRYPCDEPILSADPASR